MDPHGASPSQIAVIDRDVYTTVTNSVVVMLASSKHHSPSKFGEVMKLWV